MKTKKMLLSDYNSSRGMLLFLSLFSFLDMFCVLVRGNTTVPFITLPYSLFGFFTFFLGEWCSRLCAAPFYMLVCSFFVLCYVKSTKQDSNWLKAAVIAYSADTLLLLLLFGTIEKGMFLFGLIFHTGALAVLIHALLAAKKLMCGNFAEDDKDEKIEPQNSTAEPDIIRHLSKESSAVYKFDRKYAIENNTNKIGIFLLSLLGYIVIGIGSVCLAIEITDLFEADIEVTLLAMALPFVLSTLVFIIIAVRLAPFLTAGNATFFVNKDGLLSRAMPAELPHLRYIEFHSAQLTAENCNCWIISYFSPRGRCKNCVIPKAYPGLEEYIGTLR